MQFPKRRVPSNTRRWIKSRNPEISCVIHHRHNSSEATTLSSYISTKCGGDDNMFSRSLNNYRSSLSNLVQDQETLLLRVRWVLSENCGT
jgi:hypothetical protein